MSLSSPLRLLSVPEWQAGGWMVNSMVVSSVMLRCSPSTVASSLVTDGYPIITHSLASYVMRRLSI